MPPRWIHTFVDLIGYGLEPSWIHKTKDHHHKELGFKHRVREHPLYIELKKWSREGFSFLEIIDALSPMITDKAKKFESFLQEKSHISRKEARMWALFYTSYYFFHDLLDLLWDDLPNKKRDVYKAGIREFWLNPQEFSNLFHRKTFETYFKSNKYKAQREFLARQNYDHVNKEKLNDFLTYFKNFRFYKPSSEE